VLAGRQGESKARFDYQAVDACITYLFQLDQAHIVTVESLGTPDRLSPIQSAMVNCHGSQCGFCTPGFVATMHGMVEAGVPFDSSRLRYELSGNLCRCTGYSSILHAGCSIDVSKCESIAGRYPAQPMIDDFKSLGPDSIELQTTNGTIFIAKKLKDALAFRSSHPQAAIVAGATDWGVLRNHGKISRSDCLCLANVTGLSRIKHADGILSIGAGATWFQIETAVKDLVPEYYEVLARFGSPQIRKAGTIGGNLAGGSPIADSVPFHLAMDAEIELANTTGKRRVKLEEFYVGYRKTILRENELIVAVHTPLPKADEQIRLYKTSKRRDMDISTATFAMWIKHDEEKISAARVFLGGVGPMVLRMRHAEQCLMNEPFVEDTFRRAGRAARSAIQPWSDVRGSERFRLQLAENFLMKSYYELAQLRTSATA
jgi:xanthine dehydrogenase small subunit